MRIAITGTRAHRTWKCPPSAVLPQVEQSEASPMRGRGVHVHAFLQRVGADGKEEALAKAPEDVRPFCDLLDVDELPTQCSTEVALAYNWKTRTGRELGRNIDRRYAEAAITLGVPLSPDETCLTVDIIGVVAGNPKHGLVGDYKTGRTKYPPPDKFGQLLLGAIAARAVYGFESVTVDLYYLSDEDDGDHYTARRTLDDWDLDTFADDWARSMARVDADEKLVVVGQTPNVVEGSHCSYCPATKSCPAKLALVSRLPTEIDGLVRTGLPMTLERAAVAWVAIERFKSMLHVLEDEIKSLADVAPIELPDGRVIERVDNSRRALDPKVAFQVLVDRYGEKAARDATKFTVSIEALKGVVGANRKAGEKLTTRNGTGILDAVMGEIEQHGGLDLKRSSYVKAHARPKRSK